MNAISFKKSFLVYSPDGQHWIVHTPLDSITPEYLCEESRLYPDHIIVFGKDRYINGHEKKRGK